MPWNIILLPVLICFIFGLKQGAKVKNTQSLMRLRRRSLWEANEIGERQR